MIFSMNTQEYRSGPRKGLVVIELLDSLAILKEKRSKIYKRIIWSYLKYARESGFKIAHLYSCAAEGGMDYIFGGHPQNQVFLKKAALNGWYKELLEEGNKEFGKMDIGYAENQGKQSFALNEAACAGDSSCRIAPGAEYYRNIEDGSLGMDAVKGKKKKEQMKSEHERLFYNDYPEEETIKCKRCERVVHKVCERYNPLIDLPEAEYLCSRCGGTRRNVGFSNLKATPSSQAVEAELNATMRAKGLTRDLYFRTLCCEERDGKIPEHEARYFSNVQKLIARDCAHRFKMYGLFDHIGGNDVLIAVLAVDEYRGSKLPEWKRIQYFDTSKYFEPRNLSRELNQSPLRIYSNYARKQGFKKILVYASAPFIPGSDYLINCPPLAKANLNQDGLFSYYQETFRGLTPNFIFGYPNEEEMAVQHSSPGQILLDDKEDAVRADRTVPTPKIVMTIARKEILTTIVIRKAEPRHGGTFKCYPNKNKKKGNRERRQETTKTRTPWFN
ncbi:hypothetical protein CAEBREN_09931 [Caenorhabditis brenneri]|uniref:histone acetyltransferase n=1 Tax=Caenorhabditis brenneri TaxID=135651 RepID=G0P2K9_CAEBE|nr:hypothetical protein CAEBREN_09931 [Caenorhabditis brenneri]